MIIIQRAFIREVLQACGAIGSILLSIFLVARLLGFLQQAAEGSIPSGSVLLLLLFKMIAYFDILIPLTLYIATLLVIGRWIRDNELTAINACGISILRLIKPAMVLFALVGTVAAVFSLYLSPLSIQVSRAVLQQLQSSSEWVEFNPRVFTGIPGGGVYFVDRYEQKSDRYYDWFIYRRDDHTSEKDVVILAKSGYQTILENGNFVLENGRVYQATAGATDYMMYAFDTYQWRPNLQAAAPRNLPHKAMSTIDLLDANNPAASGELHWRISKVLMLAILMIFALSFYSHSNRKARFPGMLSALLVYFAYSNALGVGRSLISRSTNDPHWALWVIHLLFLIAALFMLHRRYHNLRLLPVPGG